METISGDKFKDNLIGILTEAGYDTKSAIKSLNSSKISDIELYVNQNRDRYREILKKTRYENCEIFQFLPGHAALILTLPDYIAQFPSQTTKKSRPQKRRYSESEQKDHPPNKSNCQTTETVNSSIKDHTDRFGDIANIRQELIAKINKFAQKKQIDLELNDQHILNLRVENNSIKCSAQCPFCEKKVPCNYATHWVCGNFQMHIKSHITEEQYEVDENNVLRQIGGTAQNLNIIRASKNVNLQKALNDKITT